MATCRTIWRLTRQPDRRFEDRGTILGLRDRSIYAVNCAVNCIWNAQGPINRLQIAFPLMRMEAQMAMNRRAAALRKVEALANRRHKDAIEVAKPTVLNLARLTASQSMKR
jgi:hypothetical protein